MLKKRDIIKPELLDCAAISLTNKQIAFKCGHIGPSEFRYQMEGELFPVIKVGWWNFKLKKICPNCRLEEFKKNSIMCQRCETLALGDQKYFHGCKHFRTLSDVLLVDLTEMGISDPKTIAKLKTMIDNEE